MQPAGRILIVLTLFSILAIGQRRFARPSLEPANPAGRAAQDARLRGMAAAGLYYPRHPAKLADTVDRLLDEANPAPVDRLRALICLAARYEAAGAVAASGYRLLRGADVPTVILLATSHDATFTGVYLPDVDVYETPLGRVPVAGLADALRGSGPFDPSVAFQVRRPPRAQWLMTPKELPPFGDETPDTWEFAQEVQLPFLQRALGDFEVVPILFGEPSTASETATQVADALLAHLDDDTLLVACANLSERHTEETARGLDAACREAICSLDSEWLRRQETGGLGPILTLMHLARRKGWKARVVDYQTAAESEDQPELVTGYASLAFHEPPELKP